MPDVSDLNHAYQAYHEGDRFPDPDDGGCVKSSSRPRPGMGYPGRHEYRFPSRGRAGLPGPREPGQPDAAQAVA
jgi:hypothetical protein